MTKYNYIMVRFGELSTKGKNKQNFIHLLYTNIKHALKEFNVSLEERYDHIYIAINDEDYEQIVNRLQDVSGIHAMSLVCRIESDIDKIVDAAFELIQLEEGKTFKVRCKRSNKKFPFISDDITRKVASKILKNCENFSVDVHNPDIMLSIEVRDEGTYIYTKTFPGIGGYPLGIAGKSMHMLSGGIDSPVAAYLLMKRGVMIECIHFASPPYTQEGVIYKLEDLLGKLNRYQQRIRLNIVPFTKIQEAIYDNVPESYCITLMRRMMFRLADRLSKRRNCPVISSGESVGQVASQTLQSMHVINDVTNVPVIRPCAAMDKLEIINLSVKIDTYDISIRPYEDCCTIFTPKAPKTAPNLKEVVAFEEKFEWENLLEEALNNIEVRYIGE